VRHSKQRGNVDASKPREKIGEERLKARMREAARFESLVSFIHYELSQLAS
jgi:hypothetical protein